MSDRSDSGRSEKNVIASAVERWLEECVIGLDLCPFADAVRQRGHIAIIVEFGCDPDIVIRRVMREARVLIEGDARHRTALVVAPNAFRKFHDFVDAAGAIEAMLVSAGAAGQLQLPIFHPRFRFAGADDGDAGNYAARAPYPIFHLLPEDEVERAVDAHPDPEGISHRNAERLRALGFEAVRRIWQAEDGDG